MSLPEDDNSYHIIPDPSPEPDSVPQCSTPERPPQPRISLDIVPQRSITLENIVPQPIPDRECVSPPAKKQCLTSPPQEEPQVPTLPLDVQHFMSNINITVSDYISQQYLVRGSPSYKVLKVSSTIYSFKHIHSFVGA